MSKTNLKHLLSQRLSPPPPTAGSQDRPPAVAGKKTPAPPKPVGAMGTSEKLNLSVYPSDREYIASFKMYFLQNGIEANTSEIVRIMLRTSKPCPEMLKVYRQIQTEDGRRRIK